MVDVYGGAIDFPIIEIHSKKTVIIESMKNFILRILYKSQKNLPYNDYLFTKVVTFCPLHFDEDKTITSGIEKIFKYRKKRNIRIRFIGDANPKTRDPRKREFTVSASRTKISRYHSKW